jgi:hypothetical protein
MISTKWFSESFKLLDMFAEPVTLYCRGKSKYQTKIGALCSILVFIIVGAAIYIKGVKLHLKADPTIQQYSIKLPE